MNGNGVVRGSALVRGYGFGVRVGRARQPLYARALRLRRLRMGAIVSSLLFECMIGAAVLLALAELVSWWAVVALPATVAAMVKLNDIVAAGFGVPVGPARAAFAVAESGPAAQQPAFVARQSGAARLASGVGIGVVHRSEQADAAAAGQPAVVQGERAVVPAPPVVVPAQPAAAPGRSRAVGRGAAVVGRAPVVKRRADAAEGSGRHALRAGTDEACRVRPPSGEREPGRGRHAAPGDAPPRRPRRRD